MNFGYITSVLQGQIEYTNLVGFNCQDAARDTLFLSILESFNNKPVKVFQIGAIESLEDQFRIGSGWSDIFWGDYIKKYGGHLKIVDLDLNHLAHSSFVSQSLNYDNVDFVLSDGCDVLKSDTTDYDIYYLDGADISQIDNAHLQTLEQFKAIEHTNSVVVVDDVPTKASALIEYLNEKNTAYSNHDHANGMLTIDLRK